MALNTPKFGSITTRRLTSVVDAAALLRDGGIVAFPTETVYGLGVDARNPEAIERLFLAKGRPSDNPLIVHVASIDDWRLAARTLTDTASALLTAFAPGPLTVVLPKHPSISHRVTAGLDTVGLRIPASREAHELLREAQIPIAAPSANRSGRPSCTTWQSVMEDLDGRIDAVLEGEPCTVGLESTVVDCCGPVPILLRPGFVSLADLQAVVPSTVAISRDQLHALASPGLRHPHYQPNARVHLVDHPAECNVTAGTAGEFPVAYAGLIPHPYAARLALHASFENIEAYAMNLYEFLRRADRLRVRDIYLQQVADTGLGQALSDRQRRSAGIIKP